MEDETRVGQECGACRENGSKSQRRDGIKMRVVGCELRTSKRRDEEPEKKSAREWLEAERGAKKGSVPTRSGDSGVCWQGTKA